MKRGIVGVCPAVAFEIRLGSGVVVMGAKVGWTKGIAGAPS